MYRTLSIFLALVVSVLIGCSARLLIDGDLNADSTRPHPAPVSVGQPVGD